MKIRRITALAATAAIAAMSLTGCSLMNGDQPKTTNTVAAFPKKWDKPITIDVYDDLANYMGMQQGWFAKLVKEKFNMKLNIIAPNVAGGGDTLFNTRSAAGDLGDLVITGSAQHLDQAVKGGLLLDATPYYSQMQGVKRFDAAVKHLNKGEKGIYAFPSSVSSLKPTQPSEGIDPTFGPYSRWDLYAQLGYPKIKSLEDVLPVLKKMQDLQPTAPNGKPVYGISLFKDWDGNMMTTAKQPACFYGYDEMGFVLAKADGSDYQSIIDSNSEYVRSLHFYYEANKMGLLDPESSTQNYSTLFSKFQNGQVLFSWWPWLGQSAYNTSPNMDQGKGFEMLPVKDLNIFSYGAPAYGDGSRAIAIGSKAKDPARVAAFVNWLYSTEGAYDNGSQTGAAAGPEGLTWKLNSDGKPELTAFGKKAFLGGGDAAVPAEWGGGSYAKGVSALNVTTVLPVDKDPKTGLSYSYQSWPSYQKMVANPLTKDWSSHSGGAANTMDFLKSHNELLVAPGASYTAPVDSSEIQTLRNQVKAIIVQDSWKMALATSDSQFNSLLKDMQTTAKGLGYDKVLKFDMANAKAQNAARVSVAKKFG